jgi:hypothetical protein
VTNWPDVDVKDCATETRSRVNHWSVTGEVEFDPPLIDDICFSLRRTTSLLSLLCELYEHPLVVAEWTANST